jgi:hypothetical protein
VVSSGVLDSKCGSPGLNCVAVLELICMSKVTSSVLRLIIIIINAFKKKVITSHISHFTMSLVLPVSCNFDNLCKFLVNKLSNATHVSNPQKLSISTIFKTNSLNYVTAL